MMYLFNKGRRIDEMITVRHLWVLSHKRLPAAHSSFIEKVKQRKSD